MELNGGSSNCVIFVTLYRNPNSLQRNRGIKLQAGHARKRLFPLATW